MSEFDWSITNHPAFRRSLIPRSARDDEIDDAIQDAYLKLHSHHNITEPLLCKTAQNCYKDRIKAETRRRDRERLAYDRSPAGVAAARIESRRRHNKRRLADPSLRRDSVFRDPEPGTKPDINDPSERAERRETRAAILRAARLSMLRADYGSALWASVRDRLAEFAKRRGIPIATARVWAHRGRQKLRPFLVELELKGD